MGRKPPIEGFRPPNLRVPKVMGPPRPLLKRKIARSPRLRGCRAVPSRGSFASSDNGLNEPSLPAWAAMAGASGCVTAPGTDPQFGVDLVEHPARSRHLSGEAPDESATERDQHRLIQPCERRHGLPPSVAGPSKPLSDDASGQPVRIEAMKVSTSRRRRDACPVRPSAAPRSSRDARPVCIDPSRTPFRLSDTRSVPIAAC